MPYICIIPYAKAISKCDGPNALRKINFLEFWKVYFEEIKSKDTNRKIRKTFFINYCA